MKQLSSRRSARGISHRYQGAICPLDNQQATRAAALALSQPGNAHLRLIERGGADPRISNPDRFIAARRIGGQDPDAQLCGLRNFETALSKDQLKKLYKNPQDYCKKVVQRYDELVKQAWALPVYREMVLAEAARVTF
jgi:hypothetical protein